VFTVAHCQQPAVHFPPEQCTISAGTRPREAPAMIDEGPEHIVLRYLRNIDGAK